MSDLANAILGDLDPEEVIKKENLLEEGTIVSDAETDVPTENDNATETNPESDTESADKIELEDIEDVEDTATKTKIEIKLTPATSLNNTDQPPLVSFNLLSRRETTVLVDELNRIFKDNNSSRTAYANGWIQALNVSAKTTVPFSDYPAIKVNSENNVGWKNDPEDERLKYIDFSKEERVLHGQTITGKQAVRAARAAMGGGIPQNLGLYQSGFWVSIKPPLEGDWNDLDERILEQRKTFGWDHFGVAFSCYSTYILSELLMFAAKHITECSVDIPEVKSGEMTVGDWVIANIDQMDIVVLLTYIAHSAYPQGIPYVRPNPNLVPNSPMKELLNEKLNLYHCVVHDFSRIDEEMVAHMARRAKRSVAVEDVLKYQEMVAKKRGDRTVKLNDNFSIVLAMPKFADIVQSTDAWLMQMKSSMISSLTKERSESEKQNYIHKNSRIASVRAYSSWIKELVIEINGNTVYVKDRESIDEALLDMRNESRIAITAYNTILTYISDCALSLTVIPTDPDLEGMPESDTPGKQRIVTLDIVALVFTLVEQLRKKLDV